MTAFSRSLILAGLVAVTGASGALADAKNRDAAQPQGYEASAPAKAAPVLQEGRSATVGSAYEHRESRNWLTDRRSSDDNN